VAFFLAAFLATGLAGSTGFHPDSIAAVIVAGSSLVSITAPLFFVHLAMIGSCYIRESPAPEGAGTFLLAVTVTREEWVKGSIRWLKIEPNDLLVGITISVLATANLQAISRSSYGISAVQFRNRHGTD